MFLTDPAAAAHNFQLALTAIVVISAFLIALAFVLCRRDERKFDALIAELLALPPGQLEMWVSSHTYEVDFFEYTEYRLYYRLQGKDAALLSADNSQMESVCRIFAAAGRPVSNVPAHWR